MRLTSLEIKGFKSFGDRVIIHFDEGTTSIVGPNGSGKSNVVDAMRWVLGEQKTRMLRSEKMENIIFNGTKTRKPANLAEVTLSFENTKNILPVEYSSISITRKLFRSGDSEYYLNGVHCRLKDITDIFLDTGIGPDSYSIIELKMIDEILNDKNNTVKILLEEAAGISKYKIRKKQTLMKLEETDADLNRVNDLLFEIEKSMKQLEAQAKKTTRFYKLKDEYKSSGLILSVHHIKSFNETLGELEKKEQLLKDDKIELNVKTTTLEAALEKLKADCLHKEKTLSASQKVLNEKIVEINRLESEERLRKEKISYLLQKENQITAQNETDEKNLLEINDLIEGLSADRLAEQAKLELTGLQLGELKEETEKYKKEFENSLREINELNKDLFRIKQNVNDYETKSAIRQTKSASLNEEITRIREQMQGNEQKIISIDAESVKLIPAKEKEEGMLNGLKNKKNFIEDRITTEDAIQNGLRDKITEETRKADAKTNEYELTKNLVEQMEGYPESIKYLKKSNDKFRKAPLVAELISCKDEYKIAIENYLEPFLNHFVVHTNEEAWEALRMLSSSAKGRANFFILDSLKKFENKKRETMDGCISVMDVIEFSSPYKKLFELLLGHVFILNEDEAFKNFDSSHLSSYVLLSKGGNFLKQKYVIGGGSVGLFDGKRTGKIQNLEKLSDQIKSLQAEITNLKKALEKNEHLLSDLKAELQKLNATISEKETELNSLNNSLSLLLSNKEFLLSGIQQLNTSILTLEEQLKKLFASNEQDDEHIVNIHELKSKLDLLTEEQRIKQERSNELQNLLNEKSSLYNQSNITNLQLQNKIQNLAREIGFKNTQIENIAKTKSQNASELESLKTQLVELNAALEISTAGLQSLIQDKQAFEVTLNEQEDEYYKSKGDIDKEEKNIQELRRQKEQADTIIQSIHDEVNEVKLKMNSVKERILIEFNANPDELKEPEDANINYDELRQRNEKIKIQVEQFGPINPLALESFNEVKERNDFIVKEKEDLANAKASLLQTIAEIDLTAREKFNEAYNSIRENFITVFRSLFSEEDNCDLLLMDPNNPLESDIQIIAQPKGKRPLSIHQLSGGEKTLTATALLFGIYLLKPSPFCIFDEVDAPLDDNNIDKFNRIIRKFSGQSQFIIITHNKKTMAATDLMYGITMAEMGVTQVVPVDLKSYAEV
ncbi:MAG TPA: chromosome segregation protein SMC [Bacteroidia bacterium]|nr:chromosome segregation protein SMC [Bacteroidia bacterium]